jgi:hypothetical protein
MYYVILAGKDLKYTQSLSNLKWVTTDCNSWFALIGHEFLIWATFLIGHEFLIWATF